MSRFVGRSGEKRFSTLCSDEGITCNPANEDDHGWDHVVQFPHKPQPGIPADLQKSLPPVFVQTKAHKSDHQTVRMKLSNALALARSPNPCFVVIPPEKSSVEDKPWRAVHFWIEMIEQSLKRAREAAGKGIPETSFHKRWITFRLIDADRHSTDQLIPWIERTIREAGFDYAAAKVSLLNSVGFDAERLVGTIQFTSLRSIEELIDHQLGLTPTIPIGNFELRDRRFGIDVPMPMPVSTNGEWIGTLHANPKPCVLRLRGPDDVEIELAGDLIASSLPGLPIEQCKLRVKADFLDLVHSIGSPAQFKLNFNTEDKRTPAQLQKLARVLSWAGQGEIDAQVLWDDKRLFGGTAYINSLPNRAAFERLALLMGCLVQLSSHLRLASPEISIDDIRAAEEQLVALHGFLTSADMNVSAKVNADASPLKIDEVVTYGFADVENWRFTALTRWKCSEQSVEAGVWTFRLFDRRIVERYAFKIADNNAAAIFDADFKRLAATPGVLVMDDNAVARLCQ